MLRLHVHPAQGDPFVRELERGPLVIGRSMSVGLTIVDPFLSRQHARIFRDLGSDAETDTEGDTRAGAEHDREAWRIEDLGSHNGTWVDGRRIDEPTPLHVGSQVSFSDSRIEVLAPKVVEPRSGDEPERPTEDLAAASSWSAVYKPATEVLAAEDPDRTATPGTEDLESLRRRAQRLHLLTEVHSALSRPITLDELLQHLLDKLFDLLRPEEGVIFLRQPDGRLEPAARRSVRHASDDEDATESPGDVVLRSRTLEREVVGKGLAALALDTEHDDRFSGAESLMDFGVRSFLAAPLLADEGEALGMIVLSSGRTVRIYSDEDLSLLVSVASVAALRIQNVALAREAFERRRLAKELALARRIQVALHASDLPQVPGWEIHAGNLPSRGVSGDIYQVLQRGGPEAEAPTEVVLMLADVAGKGIAASILTATLEALAARPIEKGQPPEEIAFWLSRQLRRRTPPEKYATLFLAVLDPATALVRWVNAGHPPALRVAASGEIERLCACGPPVGLLEAQPYPALETTLEPGDLLVLYSDGLIEAVDTEGNEVDVEGLEAICRRHLGASAADFAEALDRELDELTGGVPLEDDRTLVVVRRSDARRA